MSNKENVSTLNIDEDSFCVKNASFKGDLTLEKVVADNLLFNVGSEAFEGCSNLKSVFFKDVKMISQNAFKNCTSLERVELGSVLKYIQNSAFENCSALKEFELPPFVERISADAFKNCKSLKKVTLYGYNLMLSEPIFEGCDNLEEIILGSRVLFFPSAFKGLDLRKVKFKVFSGSDAAHLVDGFNYNYEYI